VSKYTDGGTCGPGPVARASATASALAAAADRHGRRQRLVRRPGLAGALRLPAAQVDVQERLREHVGGLDASASKISEALVDLWLWPDLVHGHDRSLDVAGQSRRTGRSWIR
jgi:hypothetical protein